jgi:hypothetical protein
LLLLPLPLLFLSAPLVAAALPPDLDGDGIANAADDCPFVANPRQQDLGGIGAASAPDGIGDACQCGDVTGSGRVDAADVAAIRQSLANPAAALTPAALDRCAVFGDLADCDIVQVSVLRRALATPALPPLVSPATPQHCVAALTEDVYVETYGVPGASGTAADPLPRIGDALARARADRAGGQLPAGGGVRIHVGSGTWTGSYSAAALAANPQYEAFPILLNVPRLDLLGATSLSLDADGLPTGIAAGPLTTLRPDVTLAASQAMVVVGRTTDGGAGDRVRIQGFDFDGQTASARSMAVFADRVTGLDLRGNAVMNVGFGVHTRLASGTIEGNYLVANGDAGAFVSGGSANQPAAIAFRANRVLANGQYGLMAAAVGTVGFPIDLGTNTAALESLQTTYDRTNATDLANLPERLDLVATSNEFSVHTVFGLRLFGAYPQGTAQSCAATVGYGTASAAQPLTAVLHADLRGNAFDFNNFYGLGTELGFPCRNDPRDFDFDLTGSFADDLFAANGIGEALLTFTAWPLTLGLDPLTTWKYGSTSTWALSDPLGELAGFHYDNPATDPVGGATLSNSITVNGVESPHGTFLGP